MRWLVREALRLKVKKERKKKKPKRKGKPRNVAWVLVERRPTVPWKSVCH